MATSFPGSLDTYVNPTGSDQLSTGPSGGVSHATMHSNVHDALSALQAKVGVDSSAVTSSLDYRMAQAEKNAPVGTVSMFAGSAAPTGWLLCQGQTVDYADYPLLAAVFGVSGGTFTLPDLRQRVPVGSGTGYSLRGSGGSATDSITLAVTNLPGHTHGVNHSHTVADHSHTMPNHAHTIPNHNHSIPNHLHSVPIHGHGHNITASQGSNSHSGGIVVRTNAGTFGGAASGHGGGSATDAAAFTTDSKTPAITISGGVSDKPAFNTEEKTGLSTYDKTDLSTDDKADYSTQPKTGLSTNGPATVTSDSTGDGTAFNVDVVQPYFVLNFMIRVDD